jgi:hypothetical protein
VSGRRVPPLLAAALLAALAGAAGTACGVPVSSSPQLVSDVPAGLLLPATPAHARTPTSAEGVFDIYLVAGDQLVEVARAGHGTPQSLVDALNAGPTHFEATVEGITTDVPTGAHVSFVRIRSHVATVNLDASFGEFNSLLGVAQIVYTVTQLRGITEVAFFQAGGPVNVPTEDGIYVSRPLTRADFARDVPTVSVSGPPPTEHHTTATVPKCSLAVGSGCH